LTKVTEKGCLERNQRSAIAEKMVTILPTYFLEYGSTIQQIFGKLRDVKLGCFASPATLSLAVAARGMV
jgi:hypothetical protein